MKILIVEDEAISALDLKFRIKKMGYDPLKVVDNGQDAINSARELEPDLILMDIIIKGDIDGIEATKEIRKFASIPIIYTTGCSDKETFDRAQKTKPFAYLTKPYDTNLLKNIIESALLKR